MKNAFLSGMTPEYFLKHYWNKKPCLFKGAVPQASKLGTPNEFFELAKDSEYESRMVIESGGDYPWQAKVGPFKKNDFKKNALWTLICHNLELLSEDFQDLKQQANFISEWHFDDIMATISNKGSSVGAHIDDYSVFIIQGKGKRRWLLEENPSHGYQPDLDIRLLTKFNPTIEWELEPGDMMYLPPNVAHHGISLEDSISYSIGFQSVRYNHFVVSYAMELMNQLEGKSFQDRRTQFADDRFLVSKTVSDTIYSEVMDLLSDRKKFDESLLKFLSRPKNESLSEAEFSDAEALKVLKSSKLKRDPWAKMVSLKKGKGQFHVSINQSIYSLSETDYEALKFYLEKSPLDTFKIKTQDLKSQSLMKILLDCLNSGIFTA